MTGLRRPVVVPEQPDSDLSTPESIERHHRGQGQPGALWCGVHRSRLQPAANVLSSRPGTAFM